MIRTDKNNFFSSPDELLQAFKDIIERQIEGKLGDILYSKPNATLEILEAPASQPDAPSVTYSPGTPDGSRPGRVYVNTNMFANQPK